MKRKKVSELAKQIRGVSYKTEDLHENLNENSVTLLRANNIFEGRINFDDVVYVDKSRVAREQYLCKGDILVCASSGSKQLVGKAASFNFDTECTFGAFCKVVRPNQDVANYLSMYFQSNAYRRKISEVAIGANINNIRNEHIDALELPIGSNAENEKVVASFSLLQQMIDGREQQLHKLDELIKARFVELFGSCKRMASMNELCSIITDGTHQPPKFQSNGIPFIFVSNLVKNTITYNAEKFISEETYGELYKRTPIEVGDLLLSTVGSYGHPAVVAEDRKFLFQRHIAYLKPKHDIVNSFYLHAALLSPGGQGQIEEKVKGVAQKTLNLSEIKKILVPLPSIEEQNAFETFVKQTDKLKNAIQKALSETQLLLDSLMQKSFE